MLIAAGAQTTLQTTVLSSHSTERSQRLVSWPWMHGTGAGALRASALGLHRGCTATDQILKLVGVRRTSHRHLERYLLLEVQAHKRLVEGLHPELLLPGLHHRVNLVDLVLANQIADG